MKWLEKITTKQLVLCGMVCLALAGTGATVVLWPEDKIEPVQGYTRAELKEIQHTIRLELWRRSFERAIYGARSTWWRDGHGFWKTYQTKILMESVRDIPDRPLPSIPRPMATRAVDTQLGDSPMRLIVFVERTDGHWKAISNAGGTWMPALVNPRTHAPGDPVAGFGGKIYN